MAVVGRSWLVNGQVREQRQTVNLKLCGSPKENTMLGALASCIVLNKENNAKAKRAEPALAKNRKLHQPCHRRVPRPRARDFVLMQQRLFQIIGRSHCTGAPFRIDEAALKRSGEGKVRKRSHTHAQSRALQRITHTTAQDHDLHGQVTELGRGERFQTGWTRLLELLEQFIGSDV